jgi:sec-independent protein translocase protein TatC
VSAAVRSIGHDDRLGLVEHLDELRTRLIISLVAVAIAFAVCMWQNHALLQIVNRPLDAQTQKQVKAGNGPLGATYTVQRSALTVATQLRDVVETIERPDSGVPAATRSALRGVEPALKPAITALSAPAEGNKPVTLGIGEPFTSTLGVALLFALIFALPIVLYETYGFLLPALSKEQRRVTTPLLLAIPLLFVVGVLFGYFVVLPSAIRFFENFNSGEFNVLVQASQYYHFAAVTLLAMGLIFQIPIGVLAATRAGVATPRQLRRNRRWALVVCAVVAAFLPGDVVTMALETVPLYLLFELSVLIATLVERNELRRNRAAVASTG